jgi:hypothetical protein
MRPAFSALLVTFALFGLFVIATSIFSGWGCITGREPCRDMSKVFTDTGAIIRN